ncbi:MAG TPA: hypothetical protein VGH52_11905 [Gaiellaceae bacterium]
MLAVTGNSWLEVILIASAVVPLSIVGVLAWFILRGKRDDPDEQRWRRLEEQRREAEK